MEKKSFGLFSVVFNDKTQNKLPLKQKKEGWRFLWGFFVFCFLFVFLVFLVCVLFVVLFFTLLACLFWFVGWFFLLWGWFDIGIGCSVRLWTYWKPARCRPEQSPPTFLSSGAVRLNFQRSYPTSAALWCMWKSEDLPWHSKVWCF